MRFLLTPVGSSGDVHPFVGIGRELHARGHDVTILTAEPHRAVVEGSGLEFAATVTTEQYQAATLDPDLWHPQRGFATVLKMITPTLEPSFRELQARYFPGETVVVGHPLAFFSRVFEDKTGVPAATIHLAPSSLRSAHEVPALPPGVDISSLPLALKRGLWALIDWTAIDPKIAPALNQWRASLGLPPVHRIFQEWINSPRSIIGLFPDWFGPRQPDWPAVFQHASFPLWDDPGSTTVDAELEAFLAVGPPPVVATPGSANRHATDFFAAAAEALKRLGCRGMFLTGYPEQVPAGLPETILTRRYAPFSVVLPRATALIHHGGIGTVAQGLAAGVPQLIMPMAFDQHDNAFRATRLGVARWLSPKRFTADRVTTALGDLLESSAVTQAVTGCRERLRGRNGIAMACDLLERLTTPM